MRKLAVLCLLLSLCAAVPASAQGRLPANTPLSTVIYQLYSDEIDENIDILISLAIAGLISPSDLVSRIDAANGDRQEALILTQSIANELSTFPLGSSAGGFSWTFDPGSGAFTRSTTSFGPMFSERALTVGRHKMNFGANYQHTSYDEFEGRKLRDREIGFFTVFLPDRIGDDSLALSLTMETVGLFFNYGLTNRWDVGVALPLVSVDLEADIQFLFRNNNGQEVPLQGFPTHFAGGRRKTGFGDIVLRTKFNVLPFTGGGVAVGLDARLPTGDEENLLGLPGTQAKLYGVFSGALGVISPHVNVGYTFSKGNDAAKDPNSVLLAPPDEFNFAAGVDVAISPRVTVVGDFVTRTLKDVPRLTFQDVGLGPEFQEFAFTGFDNLNLRLTSFGVKYNAWRNLLISASVLIPLTDAGLRDRLTPVLGFDYSF